MKLFNLKSTIKFLFVSILSILVLYVILYAPQYSNGEVINITEYQNKCIIDYYDIKTNSIKSDTTNKSFLNEIMIGDIYHYGIK